MTARIPIEVAITCVNKSWHSYKVKRQTPHYVIGFFQREQLGGAIIKVLANNKLETIHDAVLEVVEKGAILFCEFEGIPASLDDIYEIYELPEGRRVDGDLHVNNVNNMWRDLKRNIKREHRHVSFQHLQLYCSEVAWRINHNHLTPHQKFDAIFQNVSSSKLTTWKDLVDKKNKIISNNSKG